MCTGMYVDCYAVSLSCLVLVCYVFPGKTEPAKALGHDVSEVPFLFSDFGQS